MDVSKIYSKKSFGVITLFVLLICSCISAGLYFGMDWLVLNFSNDSIAETAARYVSWGVNNLELIFNDFFLWAAPAVTAVFLLLGWLLWLILRGSMSKTFAKLDMKQDEVPAKGKSKKDFVDHKIEQDRKRRLFLHSLSVLQRDGRLLDFFDEDLSLYEDDQIGAAVRSIQEDCKKAVKKYIDPQPVLDGEEGEPVTIEPGFDVDSIMLVGKVTGVPPFEGVLKHRGWKAGKKEIPKLSDIRDAGIITPAEVEIQ